MCPRLIKYIGLLCSINFASAASIELNIQTNPEITPLYISQSKPIQFELIDLSPKVHQTMLKQLNKPHPLIKSATQSAKKELGMENVPVLDQGQHGSCVTFAVTGALDALDKLGDEYSQLCFLQLGSYLYQQGLGMSGWNGLTGYIALKRIQNYGLMNIKQQKEYSCGGMKTYPKNDSHHGEMNLETYLKYAKTPNFTYTSHYNTIDNNPTDEIKRALQAGHRVVFGVLLPKADSGNAGAVGWHHYFNDTWVLTSDIKDELKKEDVTLPGHMMIVTGFDDNATARDNHGKLHKGLFTLRNSWGKYVADWGTFYMSYDYMDVLAISIHDIRHQNA